MALPVPDAGLVVNYAYLWYRQHVRGQQEGEKDRPCVIVNVGRSSPPVVIILPITHAQPADPNDGVEVPAAIKRHLGLDASPSWIIVTESNRFIWPGYDLRHVAMTDRYQFGHIPPRFLRRVIAAFIKRLPEPRRMITRD